jgi:hypothetical protein
MHGTVSMQLSSLTSLPVSSKLHHNLQAWVTIMSDDLLKDSEVFTFVQSSEMNKLIIVYLSIRTIIKLIEILNKAKSQFTKQTSFKFSFQ